MPRYKRPILVRDLDSIEIDNLFSLGIIIYEIKIEQMAYAGKNNGEIRKLFENRRFPIIEGGCWGFCCR